MSTFAAIFGALLVLVILWDAFENVILPRHVARTYRSARTFVYLGWLAWRSVGRRIQNARRRESFLSYFGPLGLLLLLGLWAAGLILAFGLLIWGSGPGRDISHPLASLRMAMYLSGTTFFTLGLGDVTPTFTVERVLIVFETGMGFGFLAIIISYLPTFYTAFSQREVSISMLDARAGSPPTAGELLRRHGRGRIDDGLGDFLHDWEVWSAQLMETHLTYPILCLFRSQHHNQSWVAAFTSILDVCALLIAYGEGETRWRAQLTFAIARHAVADLCEILRVEPVPCYPERLPNAELPLIRALLVECDSGCTSGVGDAKLRELQSMYEPYLNGFSRFLLMPLPSWGVGAEYERLPRSVVWSRITSSAPIASGDADPESSHL